MAPHPPVYADMPPDDGHLYDNVAYIVYIPIAIFFVLCPIAVSTKLWSRTRKGGTLGWDDLTNVLALVFALATGGVLLDCCAHGYGRHWATLGLDDQHEAMKLFYVSQITYKTSINLTKSSILLLYLRIFGTIRWFRHACVLMLTCVAVYWVASTAGTVLQCTPVQRAFIPTLPGHCIDNRAFWYANAGFSIATDLVILVLPMAPVTTLEISRVQKAALMFVFTLGIFVVITSCLRITTIDVQAGTRDKTYDIASTMWTVIEMNVAIVCSCLPQLRPLVVKLFPRLLPSYYFASRERESKSFLGLGGGGAAAAAAGHQQQTSTPEMRENNSTTSLHICPAISATRKVSTTPGGCRSSSVDASRDDTTLVTEVRPGTGDIHKTTRVSIASSERTDVPSRTGYLCAVSSNRSDGKSKMDV